MNYSVHFCNGDVRDKVLPRNDEVNNLPRRGTTARNLSLLTTRSNDVGIIS